MVLFALCIIPLLKLLDKNLTRIRLGRSDQCAAVLAYDDDVTMFVTKADDFISIRDAMRLCERASGACLNIRKSNVLATGGWERMENNLGVEFHVTIKILGITFSSTIDKTMQ
jgi:hypothetical protein